MAWMQDRMRSPALDSYFAITANLGTHTFFMVVLPILFWCGHTSLGRGMVHILATGVFFTGFFKDMMSLPRPLSPPLQRITMSGSAALEYGFPSTHSANAVSVAVYALFTLHSPANTMHSTTKLILEATSYAYAVSIVLGRLYCGMHGFVDVITGSLLGAFISTIECVYGEAIDGYLYTSSWQAPTLLALIIILLVRIHPEPADDCPCFDDSVAFAGVFIGVEVGAWHFAQSGWAWDLPVPGTVPFDFKHMGWIRTILRIIVGVLTIFAWREIMKPTLLKLLPHLFRIIDKAGLILPRKFFMPASEYRDIPSRVKVDNVMPSISDLPQLLTSIRYPGRGRSVSVGPQSAADAYETLAYREKRRRESMSSQDGASSFFRSNSQPPPNEKNYPYNLETQENSSYVSGVSPLIKQLGPGNLPTPAQSRVGSYEHMMGQGSLTLTPATPPNGLSEEEKSLEHDGFVQELKEREEREMFSRLEKPRVRYDVEVVTKLVVYTGIALWAVELNPILFELIGLGMPSQK